MKRAALYNLRLWWPECLFAGILSIFVLVRAKDGTLFVIFEAIVVTIGWAMGFRHRRTPLHDKLDKLGKDVKDVKGILLDEAGDEPGDVPGPSLRIVR